MFHADVQVYGGWIEFAKAGMAHTLVHQHSKTLRLKPSKVCCGFKPRH
jgi:hypothetical protein